VPASASPWHQRRELKYACGVPQPWPHHEHVPTYRLPSWYHRFFVGVHPKSRALYPPRTLNHLLDLRWAWSLASKAWNSHRPVQWRPAVPPNPYEWLWVKLVESLIVSWGSTPTFSNTAASTRGPPHHSEARANYPEPRLLRRNCRIPPVKSIELLTI
jgi:hypothetical protein